jgi:hypothetical protein
MLDDSITPVSRLGVRMVKLIAHGLDECTPSTRERGCRKTSTPSCRRPGIALPQRCDVTKGFFVARANVDYDRVVLFIWILWTEPHTFEMEEVRRVGQAHADGRGKTHRHESTRKGWMKQEGFR